MPEPLGETGESRGPFYHVFVPFWDLKDTSNGAPRLTLTLEGSLEGGLELDAIRPPKLADTRKMLYPACGGAPRKVLITYIAQSQSKFVMQRCMSRCRAAGCRRRRRRSAAVRSAPPAGVLSTRSSKNLD